MPRFSARDFHRGVKPLPQQETAVQVSASRRLRAISRSLDLRPRRSTLARCSAPSPLAFF
jgi:hypothetical protein